jgi:hypothetical protein
MRRIRMVGLCLVAMFAVSALVASAAQAQSPEWGRCEKAKGGKYKEKACLTEATQKNGKYTGKYEWHSLKEEEEKYREPRCLKQAKGNYTESECKTVAEKKGKPDHKGSYEKYGPYFTGAGGTGVLNEVVEQCYKEGIGGEDFVNETKAECDHLNNGENNGRGAEYVECASEQNNGRAVGVDEVEHVLVTFKGCEFSGSVACSNTSNEGEVITHSLKGHLGYLEKSASPPKVGIQLEPETAGGDFASVVECAGSVVKITVGVGNATEGMYYKGTGHDSIIAPVTPIDAPATGFVEAFNGNGEAAENEPDQFEGEGSTIHRLEQTTTLEFQPGVPRHGQWSNAGESIRNLSSTEGTVEIRA